jgi:RecA-family ATPase
LSEPFLRGADYLRLPRDPQPWVIKDLIPVSGLTNVYGKPKDGKSFAALGMAVAVSKGLPYWLNFPVLKHGNVAYLQVDTPRGLWANRLENVSTIGGHDVSEIFFADMFMTPYPYNILEGDHMKWLRDQIAKVEPVVTFIDTIREVHSGDENDSTVMRNVITSLVHACRPSAVVLVSHSRKGSTIQATGGDDLMTDARGSSYVAGKMDAVVRVTRKGLSYEGRGAGKGRLEIEHDETGMLQLEPEFSSYWMLIADTVRNMRAADPMVTIHAISEVIADNTQFKQIRTIQDDVKDYLIRNGYPTLLSASDRKKSRRRKDEPTTGD